MSLPVCFMAKLRKGIKVAVIVPLASVALLEEHLMCDSHSASDYAGGEGSLF